MTLVNWFDITVESLQTLWQGILGFIPNLVGALVIFIIGWFIAVGIGKLATEILRKLKFNRIFEKGTWKIALERAEFKVDASEFIGTIFKWVLMIVFLTASVEILGLTQFAEFLTDVLAYLPNVIVAAFIFVAAMIIAEILEKVVRAAVEGTRMGYGHIAGAIVRWSIWVFAIFAILLQLGIVEDLVRTIIQGIVALIVIAGGIAFGLGGKDVAAEILQNLKKKLKG